MCPNRVTQCIVPVAEYSGNLCLDLQSSTWARRPAPAITLQSMPRQYTLGLPPPPVGRLPSPPAEWPLHIASGHTHSVDTPLSYHTGTAHSTQSPQISWCHIITASHGVKPHTYREYVQ